MVLYKVLVSQVVAPFTKLAVRGLAIGVVSLDPLPIVLVVTIVASSRPKTSTRFARPPVHVCFIL